MKAFIVVQRSEAESNYFTAIHKTFSSWESANNYVNEEVLPTYYPLMDRREARDYVRAFYDIIEHEVLS